MSTPGKVSEGQFRKIHALLMRYGALPDPLTKDAAVNQLYDIVSDMNERIEKLENKP